MLKARELFWSDKSLARPTALSEHEKNAEEMAPSAAATGAAEFSVGGNIICGGDGSGSAGDAIVETVFFGLLGFLLILEKSSSLGIEGGVT